MTVHECPTCSAVAPEHNVGVCDDPWHKWPDLRRHHSDRGAVYAEEIGGRTWEQYAAAAEAEYRHPNIYDQEFRDAD